MDEKRLRDIESRNRKKLYKKKIIRRVLAMGLAIIMIYNCTDMGIYGTYIRKLASLLNGGMNKVSASYDAAPNIAPADGGSSGANNSYWYNVTGTDDNWTTSGRTGDRYADTATLGTETNPYLIVNGMELANMAQLVNSGTGFENQFVQIIGTDVGGQKLIDLIGSGGLLYQSDANGNIGFTNCAETTLTAGGWPGIGTSSNQFKGTLFTEEEDNVQIQHLTEYLSGNKNIGLIGCAAGTATAKNLHLTDMQVYSTTANYVGGIIAQAIGTNTVIENCSVQGKTPGETTVMVDGAPVIYTAPAFAITVNTAISNIGGVLGYYNNTGGILTVSGASADITIMPGNFNSITGAVAGKIQNAVSVSVTNSTASGVVGGGIGGTGGVIGRCEAIAADGVSITNSTLDGLTLTAMSNMSSKFGGVIGYVTKSGFTVSGSVGDVTILTTRDDGYTLAQAGGVVGSIQNNDSGTQSVIEHTGSEEHPLSFTFRGKMLIASGKDNPENGGIGGIVGLIYNTIENDGNVQVSDGYVAADYIFGAGNDTNNYYMAGAVGRVNSQGVILIDNLHVTSLSMKRTNNKMSSAKHVITLGGVVGAANAVGAGSAITNCSLSNADISADGLFGGIIGCARSVEESFFKTISGCSVNNMTVRQTATAEQAQYCKIGGIVPSMNAGVISDCSVRNFSLILSSKRLASNYSPHIGGIVGIAYNGTTIQGCYGEINAQIALEADTENFVPINVGGIAGNMSLHSSTKALLLDRCGANVRISLVPSITTAPLYNYDGAENGGRKTFNGDFDAIYAGGLVGSIGGNKNGTINITNSFATGTIEDELRNATYSGGAQIGGLVGSVWGIGTSSILNITNCLTSTSLYGAMASSTGGFVGCVITQTNLNSNYSLGCVLNPGAGSISGYHSNSQARLGENGNYVNSKFSPTAQTGEGADLFSIPEPGSYPALPGIITSFDGIGSEVTQLLTDAYAAASTEVISLEGAGTNAAEHVFSINPAVTSRTLGSGTTIEDDGITAANILAGGNSSIVTFKTHVNDVDVYRKVKFIKRLDGHAAENGRDVPYTISAGTDLQKVQEIVAVGAGFAGSHYSVTSDFNYLELAPIGSSNLITSTNRSAEDNAQPFMGTFEGGNHTITITSTSESCNYNGLFGTTFWATIQNLKVNYSGALALEAAGAAGGVVGYAMASKTLNVQVEALTGITKNTDVFGGIIGISKASNTVDSKFIGRIAGGGSLGGIVGSLESSNQVYYMLATVEWKDIIGATTYNKASFGYNAGSDFILRCSVSGDISGNTAKASVGGIAGYVAGVIWAVKDSFMFGNVDGGRYVGGLIGQVGNGQVDGIVKQCYMRGNVSAVDYAGGLIGFSLILPTTATTVKDAYFVGQITCDGVLGALAGVSLLASGFNYDRQIAGDIPDYGDNPSATTGLSTAEMAALSITGFVGPAVRGTRYPTISAITGQATPTGISEASTKMVCTFSDGTTSNGAYSFLPDRTLTVLNSAGDKITTTFAGVQGFDQIPKDTVADIGISVNGNILTNTSAIGKFTVEESYLDTALNGYPLIINTKVLCVPFYGEGTQENPYSIYNVTVLKTFRNYINNVYSGLGQYFALTMGDSDLAATLGYTLTGQLGDNTNGWVYNLSGEDWTEGIGTKDHPFKGTLSGRGRIISNLLIEKSPEKTSNTDEFYGFFGQVVQGSISDLVIEGAINVSYPKDAKARNAYVGLCLAKGVSSLVQNVTVRSRTDKLAAGLSYTNDITPSNSGVNMNCMNYDAGVIIYQGGCVGQLEANSTLSNILVNVDKLTWRENRNSTSIKKIAGGIVGRVSNKVNETSSISNCVFYGDLIRNNENCIYRKNGNQIGGIVGNANILEGADFSVNSCASYGTIAANLGEIGGIVGSSYNSPAKASFQINNCFSNMDITNGQADLDTLETALYLGGIIGRTTGTPGITGCTFAGTLMNVTDSTNGNRYIGGIVGGPNAVTLTNSRFDFDKNPDLTQYAGATLDTGFAVQTHELTDSDARYAGVVDTTSGNVTFGNAATKSQAEKIIAAQSVCLYLVRTNQVLAVNNETNDDKPGISSSYVLGTVNGTASTLEIVSDNQSGTNINAVSTKSGRRVVSNDTDSAEEVVVQVVNKTGAVDNFGGYGKKMTYYPSIVSTGRKDASYAIADFDNGDGITGIPSERSFTIYNEDQLMGLSSIMTAQSESVLTADECGGPIAEADVLDRTPYSLFGSTVYLNNDILITKYSNQIIGRNNTEAFAGIFDGQNHLISNYQIAATAGSDYVGLFGYASGAEFRNLGLSEMKVSRTDSVAEQTLAIGSLLGCGSNVTLRNVFSSANVSVAQVADGSIYLGGLIGQTNGNVLLNACYYTGSAGSEDVLDGAAYPTAYMVGGLIGYASGTGTMTVGNSYTASYLGIHDLPTLNIEGAGSASQYGAFAGGKDGSVTVSSTDGSKFDESVGGENMFAIGNSNLDPADYALSTTELSSAMSSSYFTNNSAAGRYPTLKDFDNTSNDVIVSTIPAKFEASAYSMSNATVSFTGATFGTTSDLNDFYDIAAGMMDSYTVAADNRSIARTSNGYQAILVKYGDRERMVNMYLRCWYDDPATEDGKEVYYIKSLAEWEEFVTIVKGEALGHTHTNNNPSFTNAIVRLDNDIIVNRTDDAEYPNYISMMEPGTNTFQGIFDGNGHYFVNVALHSTTVSQHNIGLFGQLASGAKVQNIILTGDVTVDVATDAAGTVYVGNICGSNAGIITQSCSTGDTNIRGNGTATVVAGAVCGNNQAGAFITKCYNMGYVTSNHNGDALAGIAGNNAGTIADCYNTGIISGYKNQGDSGFVAASTIAGIAATGAGSVGTSYNAAVLENFANANPIANSGSISGCYVDGQMLYNGFSVVDGSAYVQNAGITVNKTTSLTNGTLPAGFNAEIWNATLGYYPILDCMVTEELTNAKTVASYVSTVRTITEYEEAGTAIATYDYYDEIQIDQLTTVIPITCTYDLPTNQGTFNARNTDNGVTLSINRNGTAYILLDALDAKNRQYSRKCVFTGEETYNLNYKFDFSLLLNDADEVTKKTAQYGVSTFAYNAAANVITAQGSGTAGDPYIITTKDDLKQFVNYVNDADSRGGRGRVFRLDNDIAWAPADGAWTPIGTATSPFAGSFNGNGHEITGITSLINTEYNGVFGYIGSTGTVRILAVKDCSFTSGYTGNYVLGAIAGKCEGVVTNCYSTSEITIPAELGATSRTITVGGLVGEIGETGFLIASYARPDGQGSADSSSYTADANCIIKNYLEGGTEKLNQYTIGVIAGYNGGVINGCYNTVQYQIPIGTTNQVPYALIVGDDHGSVLKTRYVNEFSNNVAVSFTKNNSGVVTRQINVKDGTDSFGWTKTQFKQVESYGATDGVANDSAAQRLSEELYLGTYEMRSMESVLTDDGTLARLSNDGFPMLESFDIQQYSFTSFEDSNLILNLQNKDASSAKIMNALCDYTISDFPRYDSVLARQNLYVNLLSLPTGLTYNVASVAYGHTTVGDVKWTTVNGKYTKENNLFYSAGSGMQSTINGSDTMTTGAYNVPTLNSGGSQIMPTNTNKLYLYITLVPSSDNQENNIWGVHDSWDSSTLKPYDDEEIE